MLANVSGNMRATRLCPQLSNKHLESQGGLCFVSADPSPSPGGGGARSLVGSDQWLICGLKPWCEEQSDSGTEGSLLHFHHFCLVT